MRDGTQSSQLVRFGVYQVDLRSGELRKNGLKLKLSGQPFQVLGLLLERPGELVTREEIQKRLWPADTFVDFDHNLNTAINKIREALGDSAENPRFVETLPRRGYRFIMPVEVGALVADPSPGPASARQPSPSGRGEGGGGVSGDAGTASDGHPQGVPLQREGYPRGLPLHRWPLRLAAMLAMLVVGAAVAWYAWERSRPKAELVQRQLTTNSFELAVLASAISPDGRYLAYSDVSGIHLKVIDTAEVHDLPAPAGTTIHRLAWFPDGDKLLAGAEAEPGHPLAGPPGRSSLWTVSILGGPPQKLRDDGADGNVFQDGAEIVFVSGDGKEIWQMSPAGEEARKLITAPEGEHFATPMVVEGRLWYAKLRIGVEWEGLLEYEIESRDLKGGPSTILRPKLRATSGTLLPNGRFIFSRIDRPQAYQGGSLWEIAADLRTGQARGKPRRIADLADLILDSSATADGKRLACVEQRLLASVYTGDLESSGLRPVNPRRLTLSESFDHAYDWTPDSQSVLFDSNRNGAWEVFKQTLDQRTAEKLAAGGLRPAMGPDGASVLYFTAQTSLRRPRPARIMRVALAGGPPQLLGDVQDLGVIRCARRAELCVVSESDRKGMVLYALDPVKGKGRELWRIGQSLLPEHDWNDFDVTDPEWDWDVSPDGSSIALATRSAQKGIIKIRSLASGAVRELSLSGWAHPINVRWSPDGKGWLLIARSTKGLAFKGTGLLRPPGSHGLLAASTKDLASEGTEWPSLLRVDLGGNVQVLVQECAWSDPVISPDGRHLALAGPAITRNVWMFENF